MICWIAYAGTYICRLNFSAAMPELLREGVFTNTQTATISSCLFITYGGGQIFSGFISDKLDPKKLISGGLFISSLCNILLFFFCENFAATMFLWGLNGLAQSTVWSPLLRIGSLYFDEEQKNRFGVNLSTTVPLGTLLSYLVSLFAIRYSGYKMVFLSCGLIVLAACVLFYFGYGRVTKNLPVFRYAKAENATVYRKIERQLLFSVVIFLVVCCFPTAIHGALKDGVTGWVPVFIGERFSVGTDFSLLLTMILPIVNVTGAYIAKFINRFLKNELFTSLLFFGVAAAALCILLFFGDVSIYLTVICLALITNSMFAVNILLITLIPLRFAAFGKTGTMTGLLNAVTYLGCGISMLTSGVVLDHAGWNTVIDMWIIMALSAAILCIPCAFLWRRFVCASHC